jgi:hypothetical protein
MGQFLSVTFVPAAALGFAMGTTAALAQADSRLLSAEQVAAAVQGKLCTTKGGSKFTFSLDGHYGYVGLGREHRGHYWSREGAVAVLLDNGLGRSFAVSHRGDVLYMEETAIKCVAIDEKNVSLSAAR